MSGMALLTVFVVPFIWCAIVSGLRRTMYQKPEAPDDGFEKQQLLILLTPVVLGLGLLILSRFLPVRIPQMALPLPVIAHDASPAASPVTGTVAKPSLDIGLWSVITVWTVYVAGVAVKAVPLVLAFARLGRIVALAKVSEIADEGVRITEAPVPPLAWGRSTIILPQSLVARFAEADLLMVIQHERAHLHRGDTVWFALLGWIDALLWFNPFVRHQTALCRMAAEVACDAAVTHDAPAMRETYARVLVRTLKHTAGDVRQYAPAVFSNVKSGDYRMRISQIMYTEPLTRKPKRRVLYTVLAVVAMPVVFAQFAWSQGVQIKPPAEDLSIYSPGDGTVSRVFVDTDTWSYGKGIDGRTHPLRIDIDHGDGITSTYTLINEKTDFKVGDKVVAGQLITRSGGEDQVFIRGMGCLKKTGNCSLSGGNGYSFKGGGTVMSHMVEFRRKGRVLRTDIFYYDPREDVGIAQGHIRIEADNAAVSGR